MIDMFKSVKCSHKNQVTMTCLSETCHLSPFICSKNCNCYHAHNNQCRIRNIIDISQDLTKVLKFEFLVMYSPILKGRSIQVMGRFAEQTQPKIKNQQFALIYDPISQDELNHQIIFRLKSIKGCVGVGVFNQRIMVRNNFQYVPDNQYLNHGAYMITSNNSKFSSKFQQQNGQECANTQSQLHENSLIKVVYNSRQKIVKFVMENGRSQTLNIPEDQHQPLHFGVYLYEKGDLVQIINNKI